jgi:MinD-like ATPase involved in chromosome partitioning or flagellar assembly
MTDKPKEGQVITFYSYKGGTGRSMALANVACYLARRHRVLAIDWDLDAPGLGDYFAQIVAGAEVPEKGGVLEFFGSWVEKDRGIPTDLHGYLKAFDSIRLDKYTLQTTVSNLTFMPPGRIDESYAKRLASLDWQALHRRHPLLIAAFADYLSRKFDFVLIDSRSGFSDVTGICTAILPEKLVAVFTPNLQNQGLRAVLKRAVEYRKRSDDIRPLMVFPLSSRVDTSEPELLDEWRMSFQSLFEGLFKEIYGLEDCNLSAYFDEIQIQHVARYAYGERIAVITERAERLSLSRSFSEFAEALTTLSAPWEGKPSGSARRKAIESEQEKVDQRWFDQQREKADLSIRPLGLSGHTEFCSSLLRFRPNTNQAKLLDATRAAQIHVFGWPIGVILDNVPDSRPRPTNDGIVAQIKGEHAPLGASYDYWAWRNNGDFYLLQSLFEDEHAPDVKLLYFDTRIVRLAETLLYCSRVYKRLGVPFDAPVQFAARWAGLKDRKLRAATPTRFLNPRATIENDVATSLTIPLTRVRVDLVGVVKQLLEPLFIVFDFLQFQDQIYSQIVNGFVAQIETPGPGALGFRVTMENLKLEAEQFGAKWVARVYDLTDFTTIYETECNDEQSAKTEAVTFAMLNLGPSKRSETPEAISKGLVWQAYSPVLI